MSLRLSTKFAMWRASHFFKSQIPPVTIRESDFCELSYYTGAKDILESICAVYEHSKEGEEMNDLNIFLETAKEDVIMYMRRRKTAAKNKKDGNDETNKNSG